VINGSNGLFTWRPAIAQSGTTNLLSVRVADNGAVNLSATQSFFVTVNRPAQPTLGGLGLSNGAFNLMIAGDVGPDYFVQVSTNLLDWSSLWVTNPVALPFRFVDPGVSGERQRFYRVLLGP
jgi:hypothetical protein